MAQIGVQAPSNLIEMFSSASPMLWDIAGNQVDMQKRGNELNMQQALQDMEQSKAEQPFRLTQLGLQNQGLEAELPGKQALSSLNQDKAALSRTTMPEQQRAAIGKLAKEVSDAQLEEAQNAIKQARLHPDPKVRAQADAMWGQLNEVSLERDKERERRKTSLAGIAAQGVETRQTDSAAAALGKWSTTKGKPTTQKALLETLKNPTDIDAVLRQVLADPSLDEQEKAQYTARFEANRVALAHINELKALAASQGVDLSKYNVPTVQVPTVPDLRDPSTPGKPASSPQALRTPQDIEAINWARANPADPRAVKILQKLGVK